MLHINSNENTLNIQRNTAKLGNIYNPVCNVHCNR